MKTLVPLADGAEEMEAVIILDVLRRADWKVAAVALSKREVVCSHGVTIMADALWAEIDPAAYELIVLPGGAGGVDAFMAFPPLLETLSAFAADGKPLAAICAAPLALQAAGVLKGVSATAHPAVINRLTTALRSSERVVKDKLILTSRAPRTALEFALDLIAAFDSPAKAKDMAQSMLVPYSPVKSA